MNPRAPSLSACLLVLVVVLGWLSPGTARAATQVVLATQWPRAATDDRLSREQVEQAVLQRLLERDLGVTLMAWSGEGKADPSRWLLGRAREKDAALAVGIEAPKDPGDSVRIWVVDRVTGKTSRRDLETRRDAQDADRIAVAVVELVDASLSELDLDHTTLQSETKPSAGLRKRGQAAGDDAPGQRDDAARPVSPAPWDDPEAKQAARKDAPDGYRFGFGVEGGVVWPVRESGVFGIGRVQAGYLPDRHSWIGPEVTFPLHTFVRERDGRRVESLLFAFGVLGSYDVMQERPPVHLDIIGAFDAVALVVRQTLGDRDTNETLWTGTAALGLRVRVEIGRLDLGITTRLDVPFVPRRIRVDDVLVQDFSAVWLSGTAGARVRW